MNEFKTSAIEILKKERKPLHYREITRLALEAKILVTSSLKPILTMHAILMRDIKKKEGMSDFIKTEPGYFFLNPKKHKVLSENSQLKLFENLNKNYNKNIGRSLKGKIAENRIIELISLYANGRGLSCYYPYVDDEGIDIVVKKRNSEKEVYLQVKSTFGLGYKSRFVSSLKDRSLKIDNTINNKLYLVFVYFNLSEGDLFDRLFFISAKDFIKRTKKNKDKRRVFTAGLNKPEQSKFSDFLIEKRELANKVSSYIINKKN